MRPLTIVLQNHGGVIDIPGLGGNTALQRGAAFLQQE